MTSDNNPAKAMAADSKPAATVAELGSAVGSNAPRRRGRRDDWRLGGRAVRRWDGQTLLLALACVILGGFAALITPRFLTDGAGLISSASLWGGLFCAIVIALVRSRPAGLFRFRAIDLLWGSGLGLALRLLQGWISEANRHPYPSEGAGAANEQMNWWISQALPSLVVGPILEEGVFRGIILVCIYQLFRRSVGIIAAGATALFVSSGAFVLFHAPFSQLFLSDAIQLCLVGATCAALVLLTGRISSAILTHFVYNATYVALILLGVNAR